MDDTLADVAGELLDAEFPPVAVAELSLLHLTSHTPPIKFDFVFLAWFCFLFWLGLDIFTAVRRGDATSLGGAL